MRSGRLLVSNTGNPVMLTRSPSVLFAMVASLVVGEAGGAMAAEATVGVSAPAVAVVLLRPVNIGAPDAVRKTIEKAVADEGGRTVDASGLGCAAAECYRKRSTEIGATHVLLVDAAYGDDFRYGLELELVNVRTGYTVKRRDSCDPCTGPRAHEVTRALAREITGQALADAVTAVREPVAAPAGTAVVVPDAGAPPSDRGPWISRAFPWALIGAGTLAAGYGVVLWALHGKETDCRNGPEGRVCPSRYATKGNGIALVVSGAGLITTGIGWLRMLSGPNRRVGIVAGPQYGAVTVSGGFQ